MSRSRLLLSLGTAAITLSVFIFTASCHKNKDTTTAVDESGTATDQTVAEKSFDDVQSISDAAANVSTGGTIYRTTGTTIGGCATVTHTGSTITVDFGPTNCLCTDGRYRRGKIVINYTGAYADSGSTHTITFVDFYQNDNHIEGTKTVTNMGHNTLGQPYFNVSVDGTITRALTGATVHSVWSRVRTWTAGYTTLTDRSDDVYSITGSGTITRTSSAGASVTATINITAPLIVAVGCKWIEAGTISYTFPAGTRTLNYGTTPACDDQAVFTTISGTSVTITLP